MPHWNHQSCNHFPVVQRRIRTPIVDPNRGPFHDLSQFAQLTRFVSVASCWAQLSSGILGHIQFLQDRAEDSTGDSFHAVEAYAVTHHIAYGIPPEDVEGAITPCEHLGGGNFTSHATRWYRAYLNRHFGEGDCSLINGDIVQRKIVLLPLLQTLRDLWKVRDLTFLVSLSDEFERDSWLRFHTQYFPFVQWDLEDANAFGEIQAECDHWIRAVAPRGISLLESVPAMLVWRMDVWWAVFLGFEGREWAVPSGDNFDEEFGRFTRAWGPTFQELFGPRDEHGRWLAHGRKAWALRSKGRQDVYYKDLVWRALRRHTRRGSYYVCENPY